MTNGIANLAPSLARSLGLLTNQRFDPNGAIGRLMQSFEDKSRASHQILHWFPRFISYCYTTSRSPRDILNVDMADKEKMKMTFIRYALEGDRLARIRELDTAPSWSVRNHEYFQIQCLGSPVQ